MTAITVRQASVYELRQMLLPTSKMQVETFDPAEVDVEFWIRPDNVLELHYKDGNYKVTADAYLQAGPMLGGPPAALMEKTPIEMMVPMLNLFLKSGARPSLSFGAKDGVVHFFAVKPVDTGRSLKALDVMEDLYGSKLTARYISHDLSHTQFALTLEAPFGTSDPWLSGIHVDDSVSSRQPLSIASYLQKVAGECGLISTSNVMRMTKTSLGSSGTADWITTAVERALEETTEEFTQLVGAKVIPLKDAEGIRFAADALASVFQTYNVPQEARDHIRQFVTDGFQLNTMYDLVSAVTFIASNTTEMLANPGRAAKLMRVGGSIIANNYLCNACHQLVTK